MTTLSFFSISFCYNPFFDWLITVYTICMKALRDIKSFFCGTPFVAFCTILLMYQKSWMNEVSKRRENLTFIYIKVWILFSFEIKVRILIYSFVSNNISQFVFTHKKVKTTIYPQILNPQISNNYQALELTFYLLLQSPQLFLVGLLLRSSWGRRIRIDSISKEILIESTRPCLLQYLYFRNTQ